jgi:hypothetical protein
MLLKEEHVSMNLLGQLICYIAATSPQVLLLSGSVYVLA